MFRQFNALLLLFRLQRKPKLFFIMLNYAMLYCCWAFSISHWIEFVSTWVDVLLKYNKTNGFQFIYLNEIYWNISKHTMLLWFSTIFQQVKHYLRFWNMFSNQQRQALNICEDLSNFQPVNSNLKPFRALLDDVCTKATWA